MKAIATLLILFIASFYFTGCDSPTQTKATSVPKAPSLLEPADNAENVPRSPVFKWTNNGDKLQIDVNPSFNNPQEFAVTGTEFALPIVLDRNKDYFWRVGASSSATIYWSVKIFHFRTGNN